MPSLNQLIGGKVHDRIVLKRTWLNIVVCAAQSQKLRPAGVVHMRYDFFEQHRRRDLSNLASGAIKCIEDGLVRAKILKDDSQRWVQKIIYGDVIIRPEQPGVLVTIESI